MGAAWLPQARLIEIVGEAAAQTLLSTFGGLAVYVGKTPSPALVAAFGGDEAAARALCRECPSMDVLLPSAMVRLPAKKERIIAMLEAGCSRPEIVRECQCTARYVQAVAADAGLRFSDRPRTEPKRVEILRLLRAKKPLPDLAIAEQTGASALYVRNLRSSLKRGTI